MTRARVKTERIVSALLLCGSFFAASAQQPQPSEPLNSSGQITINGHSAPYLVRHLPISAFPQLPTPVQDQLTLRGCLIPQTYQAHRPENVVHASLERPGSSDWAVLCSVGGTVSLLVFFDGAAANPSVLSKTIETSCLQWHNAAGILGFDWAIDPASPQDVHVAQLGMRRLPSRIDHDALADSLIDQRTLYHFYSSSNWTLIDTAD